MPNEPQPGQPEVEILRGAKLRVTTETARVGDELTPIASIREIALVEADPKIRRVPLFLIALGPAAGVFLFLELHWFNRGLVVMLLAIAAGAMLQRDAWMHQVRARLADGRHATLFRTSRLADARLFHAAVAKAMEMQKAAQTSVGADAIPGNAQDEDLSAPRIT